MISWMLNPLHFYMSHFICILCLDLALVVANQLSSGASNSRLASLLDLALEEDLLALLPHLGDDGLAGEDGASEADLDVLEGAVLVEDGLSGNTEGAEAVEDGGLEAAHLGEGRVDVERAKSMLVMVDEI